MRKFEKEYLLDRSGLAAGGILCIVLDFFNTAARIGILQMELAMEAQHLGVLDHETLSAD